MKKQTNYKKVITLANDNWINAEEKKVSNLYANIIGRNTYEDQFNRKFIHLCSTSYLGLEFHPDIIEGAINGIRQAGILRIPNSRNRCRLNLLYEYEEKLSSLFNAYALTTLSCSAASSGTLPILASGAFTDNISPIMVYDKFSHYSLNHLKPACAAETEVITAPHNDMDFLEDICKKNPYVAYVADGTYSMGGVAPINDLLMLQKKYNLFLYLDDSHSLSAFGHKGCGFVRSQLPELNERTIVVASLAKAFGASGGILTFGMRKYREIINRFGGPSNWSQSLNAAAIGAGMASIAIHHSNELNLLQNKLQENIQHFDQMIKTAEHGNGMPIRVIRCYESEIATEISLFLLENGFFTSAIFFPVVPQGSAGIRVTLRSDIDLEDLTKFCLLVKKKFSEYGIHVS